MSINIKLHQILCFFVDLFPILQSSSKMYILNPAQRDISFIVEIFLAGVHNHCSRENSLYSSRCCEIALQFLDYSLGCVLFDGRDH
jgi:hypothetical protein